MAQFYAKAARMAWGVVKHHREHPKPNGFTSGACFVKVEFTRQTNMPGTSVRWPSLDRAGLFSISAKDYGFEPHQDQFPQFLHKLHQRVEQESGLQLAGDIHLHTFPKVFGYVFNPVSFWYFHDQGGTCRAILCEVNNTFGERHFYLLQGQQADFGPIDQGRLLHTKKNFHVSPFFPVSGRYEFRFMNTGQRTVARINYFEGAQLQLSTSVSGTLLHPSALLWCKTCLKYGWFTLMVTTKIHWQALKLWTKGARFYGKPTPPSKPISHTEFEA